MKIVMLGHSGVGKTTYMAAMYGALQTPINGFTLKTTDRSDGQELETMCTHIRQGSYPRPTAIRTEYNFHLCFKGRPNLEFTWCDYRGDALLHNSTNEEKAHLLGELSSARGIMVFLDSTTIHSPKSNGDIGLIANLLANAFSEAQHRIPISLVFTKADLAIDLWNAEVRAVGGLPVWRKTQHGFLQALREFLADWTNPRTRKTGGEARLGEANGLIEAIAETPNLVGAVIPVACGSQSDAVEVPILHLLHIVIRNLHDHLLLQWHNATKQKHEHAKKANVLNDFWCYLTEDASHRKKAKSAAEEAERLLAEIQPLARPAARLSKYLKPLKRRRSIFK